MNKKNGFTLIEMMVADSIFSIIALIVSSVFITVTYSYQKARDLSRLADNINFAMEHMVYNLKLSGDYGCGGDEITATKKDGEETADIVYEIEEERFKYTIGIGEARILTEEAIILEDLSCQIIGPVENRKYIKIRLRGQVISSFGDSYDFDLQTGIAQRLDV